MKKTNRGFTLIELLVVIAIIGLLATIVAVSLTTARSRARDAKRASDLKQIQTALELYYSAERQYPSSLEGLVNKNYLEMGDVPMDPGNRYYEYAVGKDDESGERLFYHLGAVLENTNSDLFLNDVDQDSTGEHDPDVTWDNTTWSSPVEDIRGKCVEGEIDAGNTGFWGGGEDGTKGNEDYADDPCGISGGGGVYDVGVFPQD